MCPQNKHLSFVLIQIEPSRGASHFVLVFPITPGEVSGEPTGRLPISPPSNNVFALLVPRALLRRNSIQAAWYSYTDRCMKSGWDLKSPSARREPQLSPMCPWTRHWAVSAPCFLSHKTGTATWSHLPGFDRMVPGGNSLCAVDLYAIMVVGGGD